MLTEYLVAKHDLTPYPNGRNNMPSLSITLSKLNSSVFKNFSGLNFSGGLQYSLKKIEI